MKVIVKPRDLFVGMNKTEQAYAQILEAQKRNGEIRDWWYEKVTLKLADDTRYTPDFTVIENDGEMRFVETKGGFIREDARVKLAVAAEQFPFRFTRAQKFSKNGVFVHTEFSPSSPSGA